MIKNKIYQFNPGLTQFSPNRGFSPTRVKPGFNPGGGLNLPTLFPPHAKQRVSIGFPLVGTDDRLATAIVIGRGADFPGCKRPSQ